MSFFMFQSICIVCHESKKLQALFEANKIATAIKNVVLFLKSGEWFYKVLNLEAKYES